MKQKIDLELTPEFHQVYSQIPQNETLLVIGGAIRDFFLYQTMENLRDLDLRYTGENLGEILKDYNYTQNHFGGYKVKINSKILDLWELKKTWAFKEGYFPGTPNNLPKTTFFNCNSIIYDPRKKEIVYEEKFFDFLKNHELEINFKPSPIPFYGVMRSVKFASDNEFTLSSNLISYIKEYVQKNSFEKTKEGLVNFLGEDKKYPDLLLKILKQ